MFNFNPFPNKALFLKCPDYKSFENSGEKEKLLIKSIYYSLIL